MSRSPHWLSWLAACLIATAGCQVPQQLTEDADVGDNPAPLSPQYRILAIDEPDTRLNEALRAVGTIESGDATRVADFDAILIDADAVHHSEIAEHAAVAAALAAGKPVIVGEPATEHNSALVHELVGLSSNQKNIALALDRVPDGDGREHWAIIYGPHPEVHGGEPTADAIEDAYDNFARTLHEYLSVDKAEMKARLAMPTADAAKPRSRSAATTNSDSFTPPAGTLYKHVLSYPGARKSWVQWDAWDYDGNADLLDNGWLGRVVIAALQKQIISHSIKNHFYVYKNVSDGSDDIGADCYVIVLRQVCEFSPGTLTWSSGNSQGHYQDYFQITNSTHTWDPADPNTLADRALDLEDTSPDNVNQTTSVTNFHETTTTKSLSVGVSNQGISAGASVSVSHTVGMSQTHDISDWGVINSSQVGDGSSSWIFHQQNPFDRYLGVGSSYDGGTPKVVPALSRGSNKQDLVTVWTTLGLDPDDADAGAYRTAFRTSVTQGIHGQTYVPQIIFGSYHHFEMWGTFRSTQEWRVTISDDFLTAAPRTTGTPPSPS